MHTPTATAAPRRRVLTYDALRTLAIVSVVAIHSMMPLRELLPTGAAARLVDEMLHYAVPVFVFISGALVWGRRRDGGWSAFVRFVHGRVETVALPYLAWAAVFLVIAVLQSEAPAALLARAPELLATGHVWYHLYFVPMLLVFYLLTPLATRFVRATPEVALVSVYLARILLWPSAFEWLQAAAPEPVWSFSIHLATHLPHMMLGAWFAVRAPSPGRWLRRAWPLLLAGGTAALVARELGAFDTLGDTARYAVYPLGMAATVLGIALAAFWLEPYYDRFARQLVGGATLSFGVFFIHPLVLLGLWSLAGESRVWLSWWAVPSAWLFTCAVSYAASRALASSHKTAWLVGVRAGAGG